MSEQENNSGKARESTETDSVSPVRDRAYKREGFEPEELQNPLPKWFGIMSLGFVIWGASYFFMQGWSPADAGDQRSAPPAPGSLPVDGATVYAANCVACHQASGAGLAGAFPPLDGAEWVISDASIPSLILLYGLQGPIVVKGNNYAGVMPSMNHLPDTELAAVLNYIRTSWSNNASEVDASFFASLREQYGERGPWQGGQELRDVVGNPEDSIEK